MGVVICRDIRYTVKWADEKAIELAARREVLEDRQKEREARRRELFDEIDKLPSDNIGHIEHDSCYRGRIEIHRDPDGRVTEMKIIRQRFEAMRRQGLYAPYLSFRIILTKDAQTLGYHYTPAFA